jgi:hypothetical protein
MATTYTRLKTVLQQARRRDSWTTSRELAADLAGRRLVTFRLRGDGSSRDDYMKQPGIQSLVDLVVDLGALKEAEDGKVTVTERGLLALESDEAFARQIRSSIKTYLEQRSLSLERLSRIMEEIQLPDVPDAETIFKRAKELDPRPQITEEELTRILYLLYFAQGIKREVRVHYAV